MKHEFFTVLFSYLIWRFKIKLNFEYWCRLVQFPWKSVSSKWFLLIRLKFHFHQNPTSHYPWGYWQSKKRLDWNITHVLLSETAHKPVTFVNQCGSCGGFFEIKAKVFHIARASIFSIYILTAIMMFLAIDFLLSNQLLFYVKKSSFWL